MSVRTIFITATRQQALRTVVINRGPKGADGTGGGGITLTNYSQITELTGYPLTFAPSAHKSTHATGGADALAPSDIGAIPSTGGTMTNGTLSGTLTAGALTTDETTKTNLANASGLGPTDIPTFAEVKTTKVYDPSFPTTYISFGGTINIYRSGVQSLGFDTAGNIRFYGGSFYPSAAGKNLGTSSIPWANMYAANITSNGIIYTGTYTVSTLPTATAQGIIYVSNETGGATLAFSDGTNWRRVTDRAIVS